MNKTYFEQGLEKGREIGVVEASRNIVRVLASDRFGQLSPEAVRRVEAVPPERLQDLIRAIPNAASLKDIGLAAE